MKHLLAVLFLLTPCLVMAQEGHIVYDRAIQYDFEIPDRLKEQKDQIPTQEVSSMVLYFNEQASLMTVEEADKGEEGDSRMQGLAMRLKMRSASRRNLEVNTATFIDHEEGLFVDAREFMGRSFLIEGEVPSYAWKLTGEQSVFLGYAAQKATTMHGETPIEAWFTPEIPVSAGPGQFGGLPGMILVLSVDEGRLVYSATSVHMDDSGEVAIQAPEEGERVSRDAYDQIVAQKLEELKMRLNNPRARDRQ